MCFTRLTAQLCALVLLMGAWLVARDVRASDVGVEAMTRLSLIVLARVDTEGTCSVEQALEAQGVLDPCVAALMRAGSIEQRLEDGTIDQVSRRCSVSLEAMFAEMQRHGRRGTTAEDGANPSEAPLVAPVVSAPDLPWIPTSGTPDLPLSDRSRVLMPPERDGLTSRGAPLPPLPPPKVPDDLRPGLRA